MDLLLLVFSVTSDMSVMATFLRGQEGLCRSRYISYHVCVGTTVPDLHLSSYHLDFATERASLLSMLAYCIFFPVFLREATITGPIFTDHSSLLGVFNYVPANQVWPQRMIFLSWGSYMGPDTWEPCRECLWMKIQVLKINFIISCKFPFQKIVF